MTTDDRHEVAYDDIYGLLEAVWGEGYLSPGGPQEIALLLHGVDLTGREVLDVGCGVGGIDLLLAREYGAQRVVGIDVDEALVQQAHARGTKARLSDRVTFLAVAPGPLPFPANSFDVVFSKDSILHIADKEGLFREVCRVLRPGGLFVASDWMSSGDDPPSPAMQRYLDLEGLGFGLCSAERSVRAMEAAGLVRIVTRDRQAWYRDLAHQEVARLSGPLYADLAARMDRAVLDREIAVWRAMLVVLDSGELRPGHLRGYKSAA